MKWMSKMMIVVTVGFIAVNLYLILKADSKVARSIYVDKWTSAKEQNLLESLQTKGVSAPLEEQPIYYDNSKGSFAEFLVKKGEEVDSGTSLFRYSADSFEEAIKVLESERDSLQDQVDGLETVLDNLDSLQADLTEEEQQTNEVSIEMDFYQTEAEINRLESEIKQYDERIANADEKLPDLEETSDMTGFVKDINHDLSNPIITIASTENMIQGILSENEQAVIEPGMDVVISLKNKNQTYKGSIEYVSTSPEGEPEVVKESQYPFTVLLDEPLDEIAHGTHVDVKIITNKIADATTIPHKSIKTANKRKQVFVLDNGKIEKRKVTTGLHINDVQQIKTGLKKGEAISQKPLLVGKGNPTFYTPLKVKKWDKKMYKDMRKMEMLKLVGKGFLTM